MINCRRGDVVLVLFPDSNLRTAKLRPALVVQNDNLASGLLLDSIVMTDNLATIHKSELARVIGHLSAMSEIDQAMRATLAL